MYDGGNATGLVKGLTAAMLSAVWIELNQLSSPVRSRRHRKRHKSDGAVSSVDPVRYSLRLRPLKGSHQRSAQKAAAARERYRRWGVPIQERGSSRGILPTPSFLFNQVPRVLRGKREVPVQMQGSRGVVLHAPREFNQVPCARKESCRPWGVPVQVQGLTRGGRSAPALIPDKVFSSAGNRYRQWGVPGQVQDLSSGAPYVTALEFNQMPSSIGERYREWGVSVGGEGMTAGALRAPSLEFNRIPNVHFALRRLRSESDSGNVDGSGAVPGTDSDRYDLPREPVVFQMADECREGAAVDEEPTVERPVPVQAEGFSGGALNDPVLEFNWVPIARSSLPEWLIHTWERPLKGIPCCERSGWSGKSLRPSQILCILQCRVSDSLVPF